MVIGGDAQAPCEGGFQAGIIQSRLNLGAATERHHQLDAKAAEQSDVVDDVDKIAVLNGIPGHGQDDGSAAMGVDVRRGMAESVQPVV